MGEQSVLETFDNPAREAYVIEHLAEEFTSLCPMTGHPDFGIVTIRYEPRHTCVELKSLKTYLQGFRDEGIFYEALTNRIRDDLVRVLEPVWLQVRTDWRGRGGIRSTIRADHGPVPTHFLGT